MTSACKLAFVTKNHRCVHLLSVQTLFGPALAARTLLLWVGHSVALVYSGYCPNTLAALTRALTSSLVYLGLATCLDGSWRATFTHLSPAARTRHLTAAPSTSSHSTSQVWSSNQSAVSSSKGSLPDDGSHTVSTAVSEE
jgi:hypothetical protein